MATQQNHYQALHCLQSISNGSPILLSITQGSWSNSVMIRDIEEAIARDMLPLSAWNMYTNME